MLIDELMLMMSEYLDVQSLNCLMTSCRHFLEVLDCDFTWKGRCERDKCIQLLDKGRNEHNVPWKQYYMCMSCIGFSRIRRSKDILVSEDGLSAENTATQWELISAWKRASLPRNGYLRVTFAEESINLAEIEDYGYTAIAVASRSVYENSGDGWWSEFHTYVIPGDTTTHYTTVECADNGHMSANGKAATTLKGEWTDYSCTVHVALNSSFEPAFEVLDAASGRGIVWFTSGDALHEPVFSKVVDDNLEMDIVCTVGAALRLKIVSASYSLEENVTPTGNVFQ